MNFCPNCGSRIVENSKFCASCGTPVTTATVSADSGTASAPPAAPTTSAAPSPPAVPPTEPMFDSNQLEVMRARVKGSAFFSGDWRGAVRTVLAGLGAMLGLSFIAILLADTSTGTRKIADLIGSTTATVAQAAGGSMRLAGDTEADLSFRPLGVTVLGFVLMALLFVRRLRSQGTLSPSEIGLQAVRLATVLAAGLLVVALLNQVDDEPEGFSVSIDVMSTLFSGVLTLAVALAIAAVLALPSLFPGRLAGYRVLIVGPLQATLWLVVVACAVTALALIVWTFSVVSDVNESGGAESVATLWRLEIAGLLLVLPNAGLAALLFGMGVPATGNLGGSLGVYGGGSGSISVLDAIDSDQRFWLWPLVVVVMLLIAGVAAARRSPIGPNGRPIGYWFAVVLPVTMFIFALHLSADASISAVSVLQFIGSAGFDYLFVLLFGALYGLGAGMLGSVLVARRNAPQQAPPNAM